MLTGAFAPVTVQTGPGDVWDGHVRILDGLAVRDRSLGFQSTVEALHLWCEGVLKVSPTEPDLVQVNQGMTNPYMEAAAIPSHRVAGEAIQPVAAREVPEEDSELSSTQRRWRTDTDWVMVTGLAAPNAAVRSPKPSGHQHRVEKMLEKRSSVGILGSQKLWSPTALLGPSFLLLLLLLFLSCDLGQFAAVP